MIQRFALGLANLFAGLIDPTRPAKGPPPAQLIPFCRWALQGAWLGIGIAVFAALLVGALDTLIAFLLGRVVDLAATIPPDRLWPDHSGFLIFCFVFLVVLRPAAFALGSATNSIAVAPSLFNQIMGRLHRFTLGQPVTFFDNDFAGRIAQKEMQTARALTEVVHETVNAIVFAIAAVASSLAFFGIVSLWLLVCLAAWFVAYIVLLTIFLPRLRARSGARANARAAVNGQVVDTITNIRTVKLFAGAAREDDAITEALSHQFDTAQSWARLAVLFRFSLFVLSGALPALTLGTALWLWQNGLVTAGEIAAIGALSIRLSQMSGWISWTLMGIFSNIGEVEDGMKTLTPPVALTDAPNAQALQDGPPEVVLENLHFQYGRQAGGLLGIDLKVAPGEKLGLVGASGAGKSTALAMVLRLYDPERGRVLVAGQDIREVTQDSLRHRIAMVTQDTAMFNRSARDNIRYGRPEATDAEVEAAARQAEAHDFIGTLADQKGRTGYDAYLGERGVKLSGGQRQRIALARALLKDAPILLLDEATSALDSEVEAAIQSALARVMQGKTVIAIAHRLSTLRGMDRIVVLDEGRIIEEGSHETLLSQNGAYARLWERQTGLFLGKAAE